MVAFPAIMDRPERPENMDDAPPPSPNPPFVPTGDADPSDPAGDSPDPPRADFLAQLVLSPRGTTGSEAGAGQGWAIQQLWELYAEPIAKQVGSKYRNCVPPDFAGNAFGLLWEKLIEGKYDWRRGSFKGWWRTVLTNLARDAWDASRGSVPMPAGIDPTAPPVGGTAEAVLEALSDRLAETRRGLDVLSVRRELRAQVNYYAFFLIELRRALVGRLKKAKALPGLSHLSPPWQSLRDSEVIDRLFPWGAGEQSLAFRPDLITLGELWERLRPLIDQPPHDLGAENVCACIVSPTGEAVTRDVWYNWKRHLRRKLEEIGSLGRWEEMLP
jgi:hypothetical protein